MLRVILSYIAVCSQYRKWCNLPSRRVFPQTIGIYSWAVVGRSEVPNRSFLIYTLWTRG